MDIEENLSMAVFVDFDNIEIGLKTTISKDFDISLVLEALKERGDVVCKIAYGDWNMAGDYSRHLSQHAVQMVQRNVTPRGDKNGADINLALDALEMAFTRNHINAFVIVGGDSDFISLVEKLKQYGKRVIIVGGRNFTSTVLKRNCHEFIAYENLMQAAAAARGARSSARRGGRGAAAPDSLEEVRTALPLIERCLHILADREITPQLGAVKSTLLQLDPTFSERDYGVSSFLEFCQALAKQSFIQLKRMGRTYFIEMGDGSETEAKPISPAPAKEPLAPQPLPLPVSEEAPGEDMEPMGPPPEAEEFERALALLKQAVQECIQRTGYQKPYIRRVISQMQELEPSFDPKYLGFRSMTDFFHYARREGAIRLERDSRSGWLVSLDEGVSLPVSSEESPLDIAPEAIQEALDIEKEVLSRMESEPEISEEPPVMAPDEEEEILPSEPEPVAPPQKVPMRLVRQTPLAGKLREQREQMERARVEGAKKAETGTQREEEVEPSRPDEEPEESVEETSETSPKKTSSRKTGARKSTKKVTSKTTRKSTKKTGDTTTARKGTTRKRTRPTKSSGEDSEE